MEMQKNNDDSTADRIYDTIPDNHSPISSPFSLVGKPTVQPPDVASSYEVPVQGSKYSTAENCVIISYRPQVPFPVQ